MSKEERLVITVWAAIVAAILYLYTTSGDAQGSEPAPAPTIVMPEMIVRPSTRPPSIGLRWICRWHDRQEGIRACEWSR